MVRADQMLESVDEGMQLCNIRKDDPKCTYQ
jgi:hypothetical protein